MPKSPLTEDEIYVLTHHPNEAEEIIAAGRATGKSPIDLLKIRDKAYRDIKEHERIQRWVEEHPVNPAGE